MTQQEIEERFERIEHNLETVTQKLDKVADQQETNTQQIARLTESLMQLGNLRSHLCAGEMTVNGVMVDGMRFPI